MGEEVEHLLANLLSIMPVLQHITRRQVIPYLIQILDQLVRILVGLKLLRHLRQRGCFQHIDDQDTMMRSQRTATLGNQVGMGNAIAVSGIDEGVDTVVDILLYGVVDTTLAGGRARAVIVNAQTTATVHKVYIIAHLVQLNIELRSLAQGCLNTTNLRNLASDMEMNQAQAVAHILLIQQFQSFQQLSTGQAELRGIAPTLFPLACAGRSQLDADADVGTNA